MEVRKKSYIEEMLNRYETPENVLEFLKKDADKNPVDARINMQVFLNAMGREEEAFEVSNQLMEIAPKDLRVLFNHGWHLLKRDQMQKGMAFLEFGRALNTYGHQRLPSAKPLWTPENGKGHRVHLVLEGGFGDEIIHFRFCRDLVEKYQCTVTVVCHPKLAGVFANSPYVAAVVQREAALGVYHDSWLPGMSAALALGYEHKDLSGAPYISPRANFSGKWESLIRSSANGKIKVGIRWAGNPAFEHQQFRSFPPEVLLGNVDIPGVQFYSFQRDNDLQKLPDSIVDLGPHLQAWDDTAAALKEMDLVISSCTSVAHLSAAIGTPTWVLVPALPYFVWALEGNKSPWYDAVTLFRQGSFGSWEDVRSEVRRRLEAFIC